MAGSTLGYKHSKETLYEIRDAKKGRKLFSGVIAKRRNKKNFIGPPSAGLALLYLPRAFNQSKTIYFCFRQTWLGWPGVKGFEPLFLGIKGRCLTTWLYSKKPINQPYTKIQ